MENKIEIDSKYYYLQLDLSPLNTFKVLKRMNIVENSDPIQGWLTTDYLSKVDENDQFIVFNNTLYHIPKLYDQKQAFFKSFEIDKKAEDIPVYKISDFQEYLGETAKKEFSCYFLIADKDKDKQGFDKIKELGFDHFHKSENLDAKNGTDVFLVFKNEVYPCSNLIQNKKDENFSSNPAVKDLLSALCIPESKDIPQYKLGDVLKQQDKDIESVGNNFQLLRSIPVNRRTDAVCMESVRRHLVSIDDIPLYMLTAERIDQLLEISPTLIGELPKEKLDEFICLRAVKKDSSTFLWLPEEFRTERVCLEAYNKVHDETDDPSCLESIVELIPHPEACLKLLKQYEGTDDFGYIMESIPESSFNQNLALEAVKMESYAIIDIPDKYKSEELSKIAFDMDCYNLACIPDRYKSEEMCQQAISRSTTDKEPHIILSFIPYPDMILQAINKEFKQVPAKELVEYIPKEVMNNEIVTELIKRDPNVLPDIPCHLRTEAICLEAIQGATSIDPLYHIPRLSMSLRVCYRLTSKFPQALGLILPEDKRTDHICLKATKQDESLKKYVPESILKDKYMNIYNFNLMVEKKIDGKLSYQETKDLYNGKKISINYSHPQLKQGEKVNISYNHEMKLLDFRFINKSEQLSQLIKQNVSSKKSMEKGTKL